MKRNRRVIFFFLLLFLGSWLTVKSVQDARFLKYHYNTESVRLLSGSIDKKTLEAAAEREKSAGTKMTPEITAWEMMGNVEVANSSLNRTEKVTGIIVDGNMNVTIPMDLVCGNYVYGMDKKGCVMDAKTAYSLYGTKYAVGAMVRCNKKTYCIRGVVKSQVPIFLIQGTEEAKDYRNLELQFTDMENGETLARNFIWNNQLANDFMVIDGYFYGRMLSSILIYPMWIAYAFLILYIAKAFGRPITKLNKKKRFMFSVFMILMIIGYGLVLYKTIGSPFYFSEKYIPTKWSDFNYWSREWNDLKSQFIKMHYISPNPKDVLLVDKMSKLFSWVTGTIAVYMIVMIVFFGRMLSIVYYNGIRK